MIFGGSYDSWERLFSLGRQTKFLKNYKSHLEFLAYLEVSSHISFQLILFFTLKYNKNEENVAFKCQTVLLI